MKFFPPLLLGTFAVIVHMAIYLSGLSVQPGDLQDPDCYMRLIQVEQFISEGVSGWGNHTIPRDNAPYGLGMHWARSVDLLILALYGIFQLFFSSSTALLWSGILLSPLLLIPCLLAIDSVSRKVLPLEGRMLMMLFFLTQPGILNYFVAGRPDHHSLILTCLVLGLCSLAQIILTPGKTAHYLLCSLWISIGLWTSIESLVGWAGISAALTVLWIYNKVDALRILYFQGSVFLWCAVLTWFETPELIFSPTELDRLNGIHLFIFLLVTVAWGILILVHGSVIKKATLGSLTGIMVITALIQTFPVLLQGPFGNVSEELKSLWLNHVQELHPLGANASSLLIGILAWLPATIPGLLFFIFLLKAKPSSLARHHVPLLCWGVLALLTTALALYQKRWVAYADLLWIVPAALGIYLLFQGLESHKFFRLYRALILVVVCGGPAVLAAVLESEPPPQPLAAILPSDIPVTKVVHSPSLPQFIAADPAMNRADCTVLAFIDQGPEILYRTRTKTLASPYHRNDRGILDAHAVLVATNSTLVLKVLTTRKVDWIVVGDNATEASYYEGPDTLYADLLQGDLPAWLEEHQRIQTPHGLYIIFKVNIPAPSTSAQSEETGHQTMHFFQTLASTTGNV